MSEKQVIIHSATRKFAHYLHTISQRYQKLDFDRKQLSCMDVNLSVIERFKLCEHNLKKLDGYNDLGNSIKEQIEEAPANDSDECLDLLGVYVAPTNRDKANILLSKEKIASVAKRYNMDFETLYNFVKIHEYAHASMCPILANTSNCKPEKRIAYLIIEESLATAVALKRIKNLSDYPQIEKFVRNQPFQYRYGLHVLQTYSNDVEKIMILWKRYKCISQMFLKKLNDGDVLNPNADFDNEMFKLTKDTRYLSTEVQKKKKI